jgi:hypothetical protein
MCKLGWKQLNTDKIIPRAEANKKKEILPENVF